MKNSRKELTVKYKGESVGRLALSNKGFAAFQYEKSWLNNGFSISPFSLPLTDNVYVPNSIYLDGLFGVFHDSLPDSFGCLIVDRALRANGINPNELNILDRLALVGSDGIGALEYVPNYDLPKGKCKLSIDDLAIECNKVLNNLSSDKLDNLFKVAGSSGGARPKALINIEGSEWLVKFQYSLDTTNSGKMEYEYSNLAKACGINMPETRLLPSKTSSGYFAVKRFDRPKKHVVSASGLLEVDFNRSTLDYKDLLKLTNIITNSNLSDIKEMYTRMCFNVLFNNQDDHLKNFSYIFDDEKGIWRISPAYDITNVTIAFNEHRTTVNGKGKDILESDMIKVGIDSGLKKSFLVETLETVKEMRRSYEQNE